MNDIKANLNEYLRIRHVLNSNNLLSQEEKNRLTTESIKLQQDFLKEEINSDQIFEKRDSLINNLNNIKKSVEQLAEIYPSENLSKSQHFGNGGIELFKRLCRDMLHIILSKYNGGFGYTDLKLANRVNDTVSYHSFNDYLNQEIGTLSQYQFDNFFSFVNYYIDFENRMILKFSL